MPYSKCGNNNPLLRKEKRFYIVDVNTDGSGSPAFEGLRDDAIVLILFPPVPFNQSGSAFRRASSASTSALLVQSSGFLSQTHRYLLSRLLWSIQIILINLFVNSL
jgi:hypothetical protein